MRFFSLPRFALLSAVVLGLACGETTGPGIRLEVSPDSVQLVRNASAQLTVNALNSDGNLVTGVAVSFASDDTTIATVTNVGLVQSSSKTGRTIVRVRGGGASKDVPVLVTGTPSNIVVAPADTAIRARGTVKFRATVFDEVGDTIHGVTVSWTSSDASIVTIAATGLATATSKAGITYVGASYGGRSGAARVTVLDSMLNARTNLPSRPQAAAIFGNIAYVSQLDVNRVARANLPSYQFTTGVTTGTTPDGLAFNSTGSRLYVANQYSDNVTVVNVATNTVIDAIPTASRPFEVIVAPGDSIIYVAGISSVNGIRVSTKQIVASFAIPDAGNGVAIARDSLLYVSTHTGGTVVEFNLRTRSVTRTFTVGGTPQKLVISPDGTELWIANEAGYVQFWNIDTGSQIGSNLALPAAAYGLAYRSSNGLLYATSAYFGGGYLYVIDPVARTLLHSAIVGGGTRHIVFTADGSIGIIANEGGWVDFLR